MYLTYNTKTSCGLVELINEDLTYIDSEFNRLSDDVGGDKSTNLVKRFLNDGRKVEYIGKLSDKRIWLNQVRFAAASSSCESFVITLEEFNKIVDHKSVFRMNNS